MDELKGYKKAGVYPKYYVTKTADGSEVRNCFVLLPEHDAAAVMALRAYAEATDNKALAEDIYNWVGRTAPENKPLNNFDRVTASPEALAKLIFSVIKNSEVCQCPAFTYCNGTGGINCEQTLIKWLNKPERETP